MFCCHITGKQVKARFFLIQRSASVSENQNEFHSGNIWSLGRMNSSFKICNHSRCYFSSIIQFKVLLLHCQQNIFMWLRRIFQRDLFHHRRNGWFLWKIAPQFIILTVPQLTPVAMLISTGTKTRNREKHASTRENAKNTWQFSCSHERLRNETPFPN